MTIKKKINILLFLILFGGSLVRVWGINFGLPNIHIIDEQGIVYSAFYAAANNLRIADYTNGQLIVYLISFEYGFYFIVGKFLGMFQQAEDLLISYLRDPTALFLIARLPLAAGGVLAVWTLFHIGNKFFNSRVGYISAFLLSFSFLHVKESHYLKEDVVSSLFVLLSFYFVLKMRAGKVKDYVLAGIFFGLAFGAEYKAVVFLPVVFIAHILQRKMADFHKIFYFAISSLLTFLAINPYYIIEFNRTLESLLAFSKLQSVIYLSHLQGKPIWWWFMFDHIPQGIGYIFFIAAFLGFGICMMRGRRERQYLLIPLVPITFFLTVDLWTKMHFARYAMVTLPFFALGGAVFLDFVGSKIKNERKRNILLAVLAIMLIFPSFLRTVKFDSLLTKPDTRIIAKEWFESTIPASSKVLVESTLKPEYQSNLNVSLNLDEKSINKRIGDAERRGLKGSYVKSLLRANKGRIGYDIVATTQVGAKRDIFTDEETRLKNSDYYLDSRITYIVLTSWVQEKMKSEFEKSLYEHYQKIREFRPTYEFKTDPHFIKMDYEALDKVDIFRKDLIFGPTISIYQLRHD